MIEEQKVERADSLLSRRRDIDAQNAAAVTDVTAAGGAAMARGASDIGQREMERALIQTELNMMRTFDAFDRSQKGGDTAGVLMSVVQSLSIFLAARRSCSSRRGCR
jgi:hypothetical protein